MTALADEIRHAVRAIRRQPGFALTALATIALAVGANTAMFSLVDGVLLRPLPYAEPERLVRVSESHPGGNSPLRAAMLSDRTLHAWRSSMRTLEEMAAYTAGAETIAVEDPVRLPGASVSPSLFSLLRVAPFRGRFFEPGEAEEGADTVVVLSHAYWQERFGGRDEALGQTLVVEGRPRQIVGIAPPGLAFPDRDTKLWLPYVLPRYADAKQPGMRVMFAIGRLAAGVTPAQAATEGTAAARSAPRPMVADLLFGKGGPVEVRVRPIVEELTTSVRPALLALMAGVGLVLVIACANVGNLFLARGVARRRELAVRAALGASRWRLARQLLIESLLLSATAGAGGSVLAWLLVRALPLVAPENFPRIDGIGIDGRVLAFAAIASIVAGTLAGVLPALRGARVDIEGTLRDGSGASGAAGGRHLRAGLLVAEAALAVVLVVGAGLLARSFTRLVRVDAGYDPRDVITATVMRQADPTPDAPSTAWIDAMLQRIRARPTVAAAAAANMAPLGNTTAIRGFEMPGAGPNGEKGIARATAWVVTPGYDRAMGLRVREGRFLGDGDVGAPLDALVVNEEFVRLYLRDGSPVVGRRYDGLLTDHRVTAIVGVVGNVLKDGFDSRPQPEMYVLTTQGSTRFGRYAYLMIRTTGDAGGVERDLRAIVRDVDRTAVLDQVGPLSRKISASVAQPRFAMAVMVGFAGLALLIAAVGLYGALSYEISQRRREFGVRLALGATPRQVLGLVVRRGLAVAGAGLVVGLAAAAMATRLLASMLFGVSPRDIPAFATAAIVLLAVAAMASLVPARRAAHADPVETLRAE